MNRQQGPNSIEWTEFTWSPATGCEHGCPHCYARRLAETRLSHVYAYGFAPTFWPRRLGEPERRKKPSNIFVCDMGDLFGDWAWTEAEPPWTLWQSRHVIKRVLDACARAPWHTYQFLTQRPDRMAEYDLSPHWAGVTVTVGQCGGGLSPGRRWSLLFRRVSAAVRFVSFEPVVDGELDYLLSGPARLDERVEGCLDWIIVGARTGWRPAGPTKESLKCLLQRAATLHIPVFMKSNLRPYWDGDLRQEWPKGAK